MKSRNLFVGILILFAGIVALLSTLHVFDFHWSVAWSLWPMILIICGIAMLPINEYLKTAILLVALGVSCLLYHVENQGYEGNPITRFFNRHVSSWRWTDDDEDSDATQTDDDFDVNQHFFESYQEVTQASIDIDFGAGDLTMMPPCAELAKADIESNFVRYSFRSEHGDDNTALFLKGNGHSKKIGKDNKNNLKLALCAQPVWDFNLDMGAATANLDFSDYTMGNIKINGGACDLDIKLGDSDTNVTINTGASNIDIKVPSTADCEVNVESALIGKEFTGFEKIDRGVWRTPAFGQNGHKIIINLSCAVSDLSVERY